MASGLKEEEELTIIRDLLLLQSVYYLQIN